MRAWIVQNQKICLVRDERILGHYSGGFGGGRIFKEISGKEVQEEIDKGSSLYWLVLIPTAFNFRTTVCQVRS